jgi:hypothetical protein
MERLLEYRVELGGLIAVDIALERRAVYPYRRGQQRVSLHGSGRATWRAGLVTVDTFALPAWRRRLVLLVEAVIRHLQSHL